MEGGGRGGRGGCLSVIDTYILSLHIKNGLTWLGNGPLSWPALQAASVCHRPRRLLLQARADPDQKTSCGRTAEALAKDADIFGSHREVVEMLQGGLKVLGLREAMSLMLQDERQRGQTREYGARPIIGGL